MKKIIFILTTICVLLSSCEKMLDVDSTRVVSDENMWEKMEDTRAGLLGIYALTKAALVDNNAFWLYGEVRTGEFVVPIRRDLMAISQQDLNANDETLEALRNWRRWYAVINAANVFILRSPEVIAHDDRYKEANLKVDIAQARLLRAFAYFYMTRIWGDVPLITNASENKFPNMPRENQEKILAWVEQELLSVIPSLPLRYSVDEPEQLGNYYNEAQSRWDGALATKLTAYALLSHVAAWQENYPNVASYTAFILDNYEKANISYASTTNLTSPNGFFFDKHSSQMFAFPSVWAHLEGSFTGNIEELTLATPVINKTVPDIYVAKETIIKIFNEEKDERFSIDTLGKPLNEDYFRNFNGRYPIFNKIKCIQGGNSDPTFQIFTSALVVSRLEDITLLRAEALAVLGEQNGAIDLLNRIRENRGLLNYSPESNGDLIDAIFLERQRELMGEGHRWYDIVRYNKIKNNDPEFIERIQNGGIYWPISEAILQQNSLLVQNTFWQ